MIVILLSIFLYEQNSLQFLQQVTSYLSYVLQYFSLVLCRSGAVNDSIELFFLYINKAAGIECSVVFQPKLTELQRYHLQINILPVNVSLFVLLT